MTLVSTSRTHVSFFPCSLYVWGNSEGGVLMLPDSTEGFVNPTVVGSTDTMGMTMAVSDRFACRTQCDDSDCSLSCWGTNADGQLGVGSTTASSTTPLEVTIPGSWNVQAYALGQRHACAAANVGVPGGVAVAASCWGANESGQLGNGTTKSASTPTLVVNGKTSEWESYTHLAASVEHTCGITDKGLLFCWGSNATGQLGLGQGAASQSLTTAIVPAPAAEPYVQWALVAASPSNTCAVSSSTNVYCWGSAELGMNGNQDLSATQWQVGPSIVAIAGVTNIMATGNTMYLTTSQGMAWAWGDNSLGQAGVDPSQTLLSKPTPLAISDIVLVAAGVNYGCLIYHKTWVGTLLCFGGNESGQLGTGSTSSEGSTYAMAQGDGTWLFVGAGYDSTYALYQS